MANTFGTLSLNHFHHPWEILYDIHPFCIYIILLLFTIHPDLCFFFHTRFIQCWWKEEQPMCFLSPQMSKGLCKIFLCTIVIHPYIIYLIFIHPAIYFWTNSHISIDFTPCLSNSGRFPGPEGRATFKCYRIFIHPFHSIFLKTNCLVIIYFL